MILFFIMITQLLLVPPSTAPLSIQHIGQLAIRRKPHCRPITNIHPRGTISAHLDSSCKEVLSPSPSPPSPPLHPLSSWDYHCTTDMEKKVKLSLYCNKLQHFSLDADAQWIEEWML